MWWAADDDVDLAYHWNVFMSLSTVSGFPNFKEHIFPGTPFTWCFQI